MCGVIDGHGWVRRVLQRRPRRRRSRVGSDSEKKANPTNFVFKRNNRWEERCRRTQQRARLLMLQSDGDRTGTHPTAGQTIKHLCVQHRTAKCSAWPHRRQPWHHIATAEPTLSMLPSLQGSLHDRHPGAIHFQISEITTKSPIATSSSLSAR